MSDPQRTDSPPPLSHRIATIPNAISVMRLAIAVWLPFAEASWRLPILIVGAASDWVDGLIAKLTNARSAVGQLLDPLADKALFLSALLTLVIAGEIELWQVGLTLLRDFAVLIVVCTAVVRRDWWAFARMKPSILGKITTVFVFAWLVAAMISWVQPLRWPTFITASALSAVTAVEYLTRLARGLREARRASAAGFPPVRDHRP